MNFVKIAAFILVFMAGIAGLNFVFKNNFSTSPAVSVYFERSGDSKAVRPGSPEAVSAQTTLGKPFRWLKESDGGIEFKIESENKIKDKIVGPNDRINLEEQINSLWGKIVSPVTSLFRLSAPLAEKSDIPFVPESEMNIQTDGAKNSSEYYKDFLKLALKTTFSREEFDSAKKDNDGKVLLLEELMELSLSGVNATELKSSFMAWRNLDERFLAELKKNYSSFFFHQSLVDWYQYHYETARKFGEENLSRSEMDFLSKQFQEKAEIHNAAFKKSIAGLEKARGYSLIPVAQAFTCGSFIPPGFYNFGGRVIPPIDICVIPPVGIIYTITLPCGGALLFPYPMLAVNPYLWKKPIVGSAVLGKSLIKPGACLGAGFPSPAYVWEAMVLYFGSSLAP